MQKMAKTGQRALARELCRTVESKITAVLKKVLGLFYSTSRVVAVSNHIVKVEQNCVLKGK